MLKVKYLRMKKGVSQLQLEKELKINHGIYSSIEGERMTKPYTYILDRLSANLDCPKEELLTSVTPEQEAEIVAITKQKRIASGKQGGHTTAMLYGRRYMQEIGRRGNGVKNPNKIRRGERTA